MPACPRSKMFFVHFIDMVGGDVGMCDLIPSLHPLPLNAILQLLVVEWRFMFSVFPSLLSIINIFFLSLIFLSCQQILCM